MPFFFGYRREDPHPPSCFGGLQLALSQDDCQPGIYYETEDGWKFCPSTPDGKHDAAMIFYCYRPHQGMVEVLLAGFSGRATAAIATDLATCAEQIWPPQYEQSDLRIGACILRYRFEPVPGDKADSDERQALPAEREFIRLPASVIARRVAAKTLTSVTVPAAAPAAGPTRARAARAKSSPRKSKPR